MANGQERECVCAHEGKKECVEKYVVRRKNTKQLLEFITYLFLYKLFFYYNKKILSELPLTLLLLVCDISVIISDTLFTGIRAELSHRHNLMR